MLFFQPFKGSIHSYCFSWRLNELTATSSLLRIPCSDDASCPTAGEEPSYHKVISPLGYLEYIRTFNSNNRNLWVLLAYKVADIKYHCVWYTIWNSSINFMCIASSVSNLELKLNCHIIASLSFCGLMYVCRFYSKTRPSPQHSTSNRNESKLTYSYYAASHIHRYSDIWNKPKHVVQYKASSPLAEFDLLLWTNT